MTNADEKLIFDKKRSLSELKCYFSSLEVLMRYEWFCSAIDKNSFEEEFCIISKNKMDDFCSAIRWEINVSDMFSYKGISRLENNRSL